MCLVLLLGPHVGCAASAEGKGEAKGKTGALKSLTLDLGKGVTMKLVQAPAGKFMMGGEQSPEETVKLFGGRADRYVDEHPRREVTISKPFYIGVYEVTQAQWRTVMGTEPWKGKISGNPGDNFAASWMNTLQAEEFCRAVSKKTGKKVLLPTEAQWEYACRAGSTTAFCYGNDPKKLTDYAWCWSNTRKAGQSECYAHAVGTKKPNAWGLYDMHGNVWEFCRDWYDKEFYKKGKSVDPENTTKTPHRNMRGGSWHNGASLNRSARRNSWTGAGYVHYNYGFRVVVEGP
jgi:formylglycine-generating enzyme required for sulfatase activity